MFRTRNEGIDWTFWSQLILGTALVLVFIPFFWVATSAASQRDYSNVPSLTQAELSVRVAHLKAATSGPIGSDPDEYYRLLIESNRLEAIAFKLRNGSVSDPRTFDSRIDPVTIRFIANISDLQIRYDDTFGHRRMMASAQKMSPWIDTQRATFEAREPAGSGVRTWNRFMRSGVASILVAVLFFMARLKGEGLMIWPELVGGRLFAFALAWPVMVWRYPSNVNPLTQARRAVQFIGSLLAGALSFGMVAGAASAQERKGDEVGADSGNILVVSNSDLPQPKYSATAGVMSLKADANGTIVHHGAVAWTDANVSFGTWTVDLWSSRALSGSRGSDEIDYSVSKSWKAGAWSPTATLAYYDIQPLSSSKGGDMVSPIFTDERAIGHGLTVFVKGETYLLTGGAPHQGGYDVYLGLKGNHPFGPVTVSESLAAVNAAGPFGQKAELSLRSDTTLSIPITKRVTGIFSLKTWMPVMQERRERINTTAGFALSTAF